MGIFNCISLTKCLFCWTHYCFM